MAGPSDGIDEQTLKLRAVEVAGSHIGNAPVMPDLLGQIPADKQIGSVTADDACDTRKYKAMQQSLMPSNSRPQKCRPNLRMPVKHTSILRGPARKHALANAGNALPRG